MLNIPVLPCVLTQSIYTHITIHVHVVVWYMYNESL